MANRPKRRRLNSNLNEAGVANEDSIYTPLTKLQRDSWNGFCEIESEPVCDLNLYLIYVPTALFMFLLRL